MKYLKILYVQVLIGIILGIIVGLLFPGFFQTGKIISDVFISLIKMVIAPIIFFTVVLGITGAGNMKKVGRVGGKGILYFEIVSTIALLIGLVVGTFIKPGKGVVLANTNKEKVAAYVDQGKEMNWVDFFTHIVPDNIIGAFAKGDIIQILFFSIFFAIGLMMIKKGNEGIINTFGVINKALFNILHIVMKLSPIGAFGGMAYTMGKFGIGSLLILGKFMLTFYITVLIFIFLILNGIMRYYGFSLIKLLKYLKEEIFIVIGASSSEAVLPSVMEKLEQAGCEKSVVGLIIPTGYSFNLDGTSIYLSMAIIFLAQVFDVEFSISQQLTIFGILLITSKGAAGVTGSGFIVLASTLAAIKVIPLEGLALLIGVDRFMSEARSVTNFIGNAVATVVISKHEKSIDMEVFKKVVGV
ncbi:MAG: C4-dicarboxylate transporter DctA [Chitinophagaceae bacterium]|jgi:aerobic C4-dicarboxylate transport protein|nr:C4-dicarboxylate transporter DctA [Chitinophagaceae bacterium]MCF8289255.1 C4-dicarboxylate transporter DctA [Chitinophagaceae bacterium]MCF8422630.1 C4-dicarboxylate transporter DctA [Chitinophagaceae bacterium]